MATKFSGWVKSNFLPWLKTNWFDLINLIILLIAYMQFYDNPGFTGIEAVLGVWILAVFGYKVLWALFKRPS